jgi:hypothetical protein
MSRREENTIDTPSHVGHPQVGPIDGNRNFAVTARGRVLVSGFITDAVAWMYVRKHLLGTA